MSREWAPVEAEGKLEAGTDQVLRHSEDRLGTSSTWPKNLANSALLFLVPSSGWTKTGYSFT